jgi:hypothetical protein
MFAAEIDEKERYLGYALGHSPNPFWKIPGEPEYIKAVVYKLNDANLIFKKLYPMGGYRYWHMRKNGNCWMTVNNTEPDPGKAIERAMIDDQ